MHHFIQYLSCYRNEIILKYLLNLNTLWLFHIRVCLSVMEWDKGFFGPYACFMFACENSDEAKEMPISQRGEGYKGQRRTVSSKQTHSLLFLWHALHCLLETESIWLHLVMEPNGFGVCIVKWYCNRVLTLLVPEPQLSYIIFFNTCMHGRDGSC